MTTTSKPVTMRVFVERRRLPEDEDARRGVLSALRDGIYGYYAEWGALNVSTDMGPFHCVEFYPPVDDATADEANNVTAQLLRSLTCPPSAK